MSATSSSTTSSRLPVVLTAATAAARAHTATLSIDRMLRRGSGAGAGAGSGAVEGAMAADGWLVLECVSPAMEAPCRLAGPSSGYVAPARSCGLAWRVCDGRTVRMLTVVKLFALSQGARTSRKPSWAGRCLVRL